MRIQGNNASVSPVSDSVKTPYVSEILFVDTIISKKRYYYGLRIEILNAYRPVCDCPLGIRQQASGDYKEQESSPI